MSGAEETCETLETMTEGETLPTPDEKQDKQYILHIANEFTRDVYKDGSPRDLSFINTLITQTTNAIELPEISIPLDSSYKTGINEFIAYIFSLNVAVNKTYSIVCDVQNIKEYSDKTFGLTNRLINAQTQHLSGFSFGLIDKLGINAVVSREAPRQTMQRFPNPDYSQLSTSYVRDDPFINIPISEPTATTISDKGILKTFRFTSNAYSIDDYLNESKWCSRKITNPTVVTDPPITLWGIFTSLLKGYVFQDRYIKSPNFVNLKLEEHIPMYYVSYDVKCWMTTICLDLPLYTKLTESNFEINVSFLLSRVGYTVIDNIEQKINVMLRFFNYLIQIDETLNGLYRQITNKSVIYSIKEQLSTIINFFNNGHRVIFILDSIHNTKIEFYIDADNHKIIYSKIDKPDLSITTVYAKRIVPINSSRLLFQGGMCDPKKNVSLDKISQHCEYLYYGRIVNKDVFSFFTGDKISKCANRLEKTKDIQAAYLQNCQTSRGGTYKKKKKRTQRKSRHNKRRTTKRRKKKSPFLYR